jgi:predicted ATPase
VVRASLNGGERPRTNVVAQIQTSFGRLEDIRAIEAKLANAHAVTLTGPGGVGKTHLAHRYAHHHLEGGGSAWFCDLSEARTIASVCSAVRRAVGQAAESSDDSPERIGHSLGRHDEGTLVILDNCEQAIGAVSHLVERWRSLAPGVRWLLTSREATHLAGEATYEVGPLAVPTQDGDPTSDAVELFIDRARMVRSGYAPRAADLAVVVSLVRKLEGMPLAIELAAARLRLLGERSLLQRVSTSFEALGRNRDDVPARHATMRATIAWSWELLEPCERITLAQCAVFRGGFDAEAAEAVVDVSGLGEHPPILEVLESLCDKSLLRPTPGAGGKVRVGFYEPIREFAAAKLDDSGERQPAEDRHTKWFLQPSEAWAANEFAAPPEFELASDVEDDWQNVRVVHERLASNDETTPRRLLCATAALFPDLSHTPETLALIEHALGACISLSESHAYRMLVFSRLRIMTRLGCDQVDALHQEAMQEARGSSDIGMQVWLHALATQRALRGNDTATTVRHCEAAFAHRAHPAFARAAPFLLVALAQAESATGKLEQAMARYSEVLVSVRGLSGKYQTLCAANALANRGASLQLLGRLDEARSDMDAALRLLERIPVAAAGVRVELGLLLHEQDDLEAARQTYERALGDLRHHAFAHLQARVHAALGALLADLGATVDAEAAFIEAEGVESARAIVDVHRGHLDLARATTCARRGDARGFRRHRSEARRRLVSAPPMQPYGEATVPRRLLQRRVASTAPPEHGAQALFVSPDARECRTPSGGRVNLSSSPRLRRLVLTLAHARAARPGEASSLTALFEDAWAGERASYEASCRRVYVAIAKLRELGLRDVLLRDVGGYLLDPMVPLVFSPQQDSVAK